MARRAQNGTQFQRKYLVIAFLLVLDALALNAVAIYWVLYDPTGSYVDKNVLYVVAFAVLFLALVTTRLNSAEILSNKVQNPMIGRKLKAFSNLFIARGISFAMTSLLGAGAIYVTQDLIFIAILGPALTVFLVLYPTKKNIFQDLRFTNEEQS
jgi:low temperature requirement protein LtrA